MKRFLIPFSVCCLLGIAAGCFSPSIESIAVARWKSNAHAAYTIIHDDLCDTVCSGIYEYADTIAFNRGLRFGAGAIVKKCVDEGEYMWEHLRTLADHGHEILSHSWDHGAALDLGWQPESWSVDTDVVMSKAVLEEKVPGIQVTYFIFPYDAYNDQRLDELKAHGYLGSRSGKMMYGNDRGVNTHFSSNFDPFRNCYFNAYMSKAEQDAIDTLPEDERYTVSIYNDDDDNVEIKHVDSAIATGGWSIQEMHSVDDTEPWGWGRISVAKYRALLDYVKAKTDAGMLWMDTPTAVVKYIMTRTRCGAAKIDNETISFESPDMVDPKYATEITLVIKTKGNPALIIGSQAGNTVTATKTGRNAFLLPVDPTKGAVALTLYK